VTSSTTGIPARLERTRREVESAATREKGFEENAGKNPGKNPGRIRE
jgi:hypothetical protein